MELTYTSIPKINEENNLEIWISGVLTLIGIISFVIFFKAKKDIEKINNKNPDF